MMLVLVGRSVSWGVLGVSWGCPGGVLGVSWGVLEVSCNNEVFQIIEDAQDNVDASRNTSLDAALPRDEALIDTDDLFHERMKALVDGHLTARGALLAVRKCAHV